jgi:hypothetical protein
LIGHVLYHVSGRGVPLPLLANQEWVNAPASWSPDGVHLAYPVLDKSTGDRNLLIYDVEDEVVWLTAESIDDSIKPAWSQGCVNPSFQNCYLAYAHKSEIGGQGVRIAVHDLGTWQTRERLIPGSLGSRLRWSEADRLFYGRLNWYDLEAGTQVTPALPAPEALSLSPTADHLVYVGDQSGGQDSCRVCSSYSLWLGQPTEAQLAPIYAFPIESNRQAARTDILWRPDGRAFATFQQGRLFYYDLSTDTTSFWTQTAATDFVDSYAFAPQGDALALVEGSYLDGSEKPVYRFYTVGASGEVVTLRTRFTEPVVVLAWLADKPAPRFLPRSFGQYARQLQLLGAGEGPDLVMEF